jgi:hypothetical protein
MSLRRLSIVRSRTLKGGDGGRLATLAAGAGAADGAPLVPGAANERLSGGGVAFEQAPRRSAPTARLAPVAT